MAKSPAHRFGQILGETVETAVSLVLIEFAKKHSLYLDMKGKRLCRGGVKCSWTDQYGNSHDLDYVLERGGTDEKKGTPVAFIEVAWRRYTKHSRNKAQEIQGAILPLVDKFQYAGPVKGAILAGVFTEGSLKQLRSLGFEVLFISTKAVVECFEKFGIDASAGEKTPDREFAAKVKAYNALSAKRKGQLAKSIRDAHAKEFEEFVAALEATVLRRVQRVVVLPLFGKSAEFGSIQDAVKALERYDEKAGSARFDHYEIEVRYTNGNVIKGQFKDRPSALQFLIEHLPQGELVQPTHRA